MKRKPKKPNWRGTTISQRTRMLEAEVNALNKQVIDLLSELRELQAQTLAPVCMCPKCAA